MWRHPAAVVSTADRNRQQPALSTFRLKMKAIGTVDFRDWLLRGGAHELSSQQEKLDFIWVYRCAKFSFEHFS